MPTKPKKQTLPYPGAVFDTSTQNDLGNVFAWLGGTTKALQRAGAPQDVIDAFKADATSGDYGHAINTCYRYVEVI